ncbi:MAG: hypothetical protein ACREQO_00165 [Candidatus Binatia bacterium]
MNELRAGEIHNLSSSSEFPALPERTLLVAVLERATLDAYGLVTAVSGNSKARTRTEARAWIAAESDEPWSFIWVCDLLGISFSSLRRALLHSPPPPHFDQRLRASA